nr:hypothetical protein [Tanacetum cinerariifolium]GEW40337.1 hypothetical protein [Tanacetum cinerariifolium]GEW40633.1 hypothetical protein [Tanacetum cinerariifolium]
MTIRLGVSSLEDIKCISKSPEVDTIKVSGYSQIYKSLTFVTVTSVGHEVPSPSKRKQNSARCVYKTKDAEVATAQAPVTIVWGNQVQNDGNHSIDEKMIVIKKLKVSEIKESYLPPRMIGNVDFGWSNTSVAKADCTINGLLDDLRSWATNGSNKVLSVTCVRGGVSLNVIPPYVN